MRYTKKRKNNRQYYDTVINRALKDSLHTLCFSSLSGYFQSDLWKTIKGKTLGESNNRCSSCGVKTKAVKLLDYHLDTLQGRRPEYVKCMCNKCWKTRNKPKKKRVNKSVCPHCLEDNLTKEEKMINKWGTLDQKTVCLDCRDGLSVEDYALLPKESRHDLKDFFFSRGKTGGDGI